MPNALGASQRLALISCLLLVQLNQCIVVALPDSSSLLSEDYDVSCKASLAQALLQLDPCKHNLGSEAQISDLNNAINLGLQSCGRRDARIRVSGCFD